MRAYIITVCQVICEGWYYYCLPGYMGGLVLLLFARLYVRTGIITLFARLYVRAGIITLFARLYVRTGIITVCQVICEDWYYYCLPGYM